MIREILKMGDPRLLQVARPVEDIRDPALQDIIADLYETMHALAAIAFICRCARDRRGRVPRGTNGRSVGIGHRADRRRGWAGRVRHSRCWEFGRGRRRGPISVGALWTDRHLGEFAGVAIYAQLVDTPATEHERLFRTNYFGVVHGSLTALKHLRERGGALITVCSIASDFPSPIMGAYSASKHAAKAFTQALRIEQTTQGSAVSITLVKPSGINTPIAEHAANHVDGEARIPPPVYDPSLVASAILDAAEHPRRDVTVGGVGRLQVLLATHLPALYALLGGPVSTLLVDAHKPRTETNNLNSATAEGRERSLDEAGRGFSLYVPVSRHPTLAAVATISAIGLLSMALRQIRVRTAQAPRELR